jgi:hypothetical protein
VATVGACSVKGQFLRPVVTEDVTYKEQCNFGRPSGCEIYMNSQKAYVSRHLFVMWLKEIFMPIKAPGTSPLLLVEHASHCSSPELLQFAKENDVITLISPSHSTAALPPPRKGHF